MSALLFWLQKYSSRCIKVGQFIFLTSQTPAFRNYDQLLMLNARLARSLISVDLAQFVVTTIAMFHQPMTLEGYASHPVLYVGFPKDGVPADPGSQWAVNGGQKVRG